jgi:hypothetical protein
MCVGAGQRHGVARDAAARTATEPTLRYSPVSSEPIVTPAAPLEQLGASAGSHEPLDTPAGASEFGAVAGRRQPIIDRTPVSSAAGGASTAEPCAACGAPMAADQRYCLECGERRAVMSSVLLGGPPLRPEHETGASTSPPARPPDSAIASSGIDDRARGNALAVIAGVGVLLLAMGVGVLIGRSSASTKTPAPQVITVGSAPATGSTGAGEAGAASFASDWPSGTSGYTVQLQTLPQSGTQVSAVQAAKAAASVKGAKNVGALKSEEFSSLGGTNYVIYSGVYHKRSEAQNALKGLKKSFPAATVLKVSNGTGQDGGGGSSSKSSGSSEGGATHHSGVGYSESKPAPPTVLKKGSKENGQSYEQKSKNLPDVVSTG